MYIFLAMNNLLFVNCFCTLYAAYVHCIQDVKIAFGKP